MLNTAILLSAIHTHISIGPDISVAGFGGVWLPYFALATPNNIAEKAHRV
jgi:hypothetical protein